MFNPIVNSNNDDDIFDDNQTLSNPDPAPTGSSLNDSLNNTIYDLFNGDDSSVDSVKKLIDHIQKEHGLNINDILGNVRTEFVSTFYESVNKWIFDYKADKTSLAVYSALSDLTNQRYPLFSKYYELELSIAKRKVILKFLDGTFCSDNSSEALGQISSVLNTNLDPRFTATYFQSVYDIMEFTITQEIALYKAVAKEINLQINQEVIDHNVSIASLSSQTRKDEIFASALSPALKESISSHLMEEMKIYESKEGQ